MPPHPLTNQPPPLSKLQLSDRLIALADESQRSGLRQTALILMALAHQVFDEQPAERELPCRSDASPFRRMLREPLWSEPDNFSDV